MRAGNAYDFFLAHLIASLTSFLVVFLSLNFFWASSASFSKSILSSGILIFLKYTPSASCTAAKVSPGLRFNVSLISLGTTSCPFSDILTISAPGINTPSLNS